MLPKVAPLIDAVRLYNNFARMGKHAGHLSVDLEVYPTPQIKWHFEVLGDEVIRSGNLSDSFPLEGYQFKIEHPVVTSSHHDSITPLESLNGMTTQANFGDPDNDCHTVIFYLPNALFQARNHFGQKRIRKTLRLGKRKIEEKEDEGRVIDSELVYGWSVSIETRREALDWCDDFKSNVGTRITTRGALYARMSPKANLAAYPTISLRTAIDYIETLCVLLSYVNGGYIGPLYVEGKSYKTEPQSYVRSDAVAFAYKTTPIELLGRSWLAMDSDLEAYISCFSTLHRMLTGSVWIEALPVTLAWYFQAIQPDGPHSSSKEWPIVANALGTALERLSYTILVLEEDDPSEKEKFETLFSQGNDYKRYWRLDDVSRTAKRLHILLERIGFTNAHCLDIKEVRNFLKVRNEATHPKTAHVNQATIPYYLSMATQWVEEILLWRLGYNGKYWSRFRDGWQSTAPRYDLRTRHSTW